MSILEQIEKTIAENPIVLYMKGTPDFPQCGFSGRVVNILRQCGVNFIGINVLENEAIRQGIKEYAHWPTIPQLYVNGEFIGGCDIVSELYENGELQGMLGVNAN